MKRWPWFIPALSFWLLFSSAAARGEGIPERVEPRVAGDSFAGQTVRDRETGMMLIEARGKNVPKVGQMAPDFELRTADGRKTVRLSSFRGKQPVVLIFGSHT